MSYIHPPNDDYLDSGNIDESIVNVKNDERKISILNGTAEVLVQEKSIHITQVENGIIISDYGTIIKGKTHLADTPSNIRINGFWVFNDDLLTTLPSTIYTPIPVLKYKESPYVKMIQGMIKSYTT